MMQAKPEIREETIVEAFAEDIAVHGWKVVSHSVKQSHDKQERTLTISAVRSTGEAQQENMDLNDGRRGRRRKAAEPDATGDGS